MLCLLWVLRYSFICSEPVKNCIGVLGWLKYVGMLGWFKLVGMLCWLELACPTACACLFKGRLGVLSKTLSHMLGILNLPIFLFNVGLLTLINVDFLILLANVGPRTQAGSTSSKAASISSSQASSASSQLIRTSSPQAGSISSQAVRANLPQASSTGFQPGRNAGIAGTQSQADSTSSQAARVRSTQTSRCSSPQAGSP